MTDERHPAQLYAEQAAESIRAINHASVAVDSIEQPSLLYRLLGELYTLAAHLDQAFGQFIRPLQRLDEAGGLQVDAGAPFAGRPDLAVKEAVGQLRDAQLAARSMYESLAAAQGAISGLYAQ